VFELLRSVPFQFTSVKWSWFSTDQHLSLSLFRVQLLPRRYRSLLSSAAVPLRRTVPFQFIELGFGLSDFRPPNISTHSYSARYYHWYRKCNPEGASHVHYKQGPNPATLVYSYDIGLYRFVQHVWCGMDTSTSSHDWNLSQRAIYNISNTTAKGFCIAPWLVFRFRRVPFCCPVIFLDGSDTAWSSVPRHGILTAQASSTGLAALGASMDRLVHPARLTFELMLVGFVSSLGWDVDSRPCAGRLGPPGNGQGLCTAS
jgi:hypothetical protein